MTTRWQSYLCPGLLSSAFRRFPAAMFSNLQFIPECLDLLSSRNVQCSLVEITFSAHHGRWLVPKPSQTLPFAQVPVRAVAGVAGGREAAGSPVQAGLGLAGTVP